MDSLNLVFVAQKWSTEIYRTSRLANHRRQPSFGAKFVVRIHAGEPPFAINNLQNNGPVLVRILYRRLQARAVQLIDAVIKARWAWIGIWS